jgi:hypothetical protein
MNPPWRLGSDMSNAELTLGGADLVAAQNERQTLTVARRPRGKGWAIPFCAAAQQTASGRYRSIPTGGKRTRRFRTGRNTMKVRLCAVLIGAIIGLLATLAALLSSGGRGG